jgi:hypothetical protein
MSPLGIILLGFLFVVLGVVLPLLMMLNVIPTTFAISFLSFGLSVAGVLMGIVGASRYVVRRRK